MVARQSPKLQAGVRLPPPMPRGLAQSGSALALGARGRRFESCIPDQLCGSGGMVTQGIANPYNAGSSPVSHSMVDIYLIDVILVFVFGPFV